MRAKPGKKSKERAEGGNGRLLAHVKPEEDIRRLEIFF